MAFGLISLFNRSMSILSFLLYFLINVFTSTEHLPLDINPMARINGMHPRGPTPTTTIFRAPNLCSRYKKKWFEN